MSHHKKEALRLEESLELMASLPEPDWGSIPDFALSSLPEPDWDEIHRLCENADREILKCLESLPEPDWSSLSPSDAVWQKQAFEINKSFCDSLRKRLNG